MDKILLEVEIEDSSVTSAVVEIQKATESIKSLKAAQADLAAQGQTNSAQFIKNNEDIKTLNKTISDNSKTIQANNQLQKAAKDSIDGLRAANTLLIKEKNSLSTTDEASKKRIAEINALYDKNTKTIAANSSATEKQKMNIGNYGSALDKIIPGLGGMISGIESSTKAALAFIATPIGAVIGALGLAIGALSAYFKGSEEGQDRFAKLMSIGKVAVDAMIQVVEKLGEVVADTLDFVGNLSRKVIDFVAPSIGKMLDETIKAGEAIADLQDKIEQDENKLIVSRAETDKKVAELREKALSQEGAQKRKTIQEAINLEKQLSAEETKHAQDKLDHLNLVASQEGKLTEEQKKQQAELTANIINQEAQQYQATLRFQKEIEKLNDEDAKNKQKIIDDQNKRLENDQKIHDKNIENKQSEVHANLEADAQIEASAQEVQDLFNQQSQQQTDNEIKQGNFRYEAYKKEKEAKKKLDDAELKAKEENNKQIMAIVQIGQNLVQALFGKSKIAGAAEAILNGIKGFMQAVGAYPPPYGEILGGISLAAGAKSAAEIGGLTFEEGGVIPISGKSHTAGGEDVAIGGQTVANVQGGEHLVVLKRGAYDIFNQLSRANELAGGVPFSRDSSPRRYLADGGFVARTASVSVPSMDQLAQQFTNSISGLKIYTRTTELQKVQDNVAQVKVLSELR